MAETHGLERLGPRRGTRPATTPTNPHQQLDQNAPTDLQEELFGRGLELAGVHPGPSGISVPGARAFHLEPRLAKGPLQAFMVGTEFAHLHPPYDGSLHLMLPEETALSVVALGWGELHPVVRMGLLPPTALMIYGPRNAPELEAVWLMLLASHAFARGATTEA